MSRSRRSPAEANVATEANVPIEDELAKAEEEVERKAKALCDLRVAIQAFRTTFGKPAEGEEAEAEAAAAGLDEEE